MGAKQSKRRGLLKEDLDYLLGKISIVDHKQAGTQDWICTRKIFHELMLH